MAGSTFLPISSLKNIIQKELSLAVFYTEYILPMLKICINKQYISILGLTCNFQHVIKLNYVYC